MRSVFRTDHPLSLTAGLLSDHLGAYLHAGARFISTHIEKFTESTIMSCEIGHLVTSKEQSRDSGELYRVLQAKEGFGVFLRAE